MTKNHKFASKGAKESIQHTVPAILRPHIWIQNINNEINESQMVTKMKRNLRKNNSRDRHAGNVANIGVKKEKLVH